MTSKRPPAKKRRSRPAPSMTKAPVTRAPPAPNAIDELRARIAHEVNNPLTVVVANSELLAETLAFVQTEAPTRLAMRGAHPWLRAHLSEALERLDDIREAVERIRLAVRPPASPAARFEGAEEATATRRAVLRRAHVLVIDDQEDVAHALGRMLSTHDVEVSTSPRASLERIERGERFDVIVCDMMMAEMAGSDLHAKLRERWPEQAARMVFVTGAATSPETQAFAARITQPVLVKPFASATLEAVVREITR